MGTSSKTFADTGPRLVSQEGETRKRHRKMTEKGLSTAKAQLFDKRAKIIRSVNNKARMLQALMNNPADFTQFKSEYQNFVDIISDLSGC